MRKLLGLLAFVAALLPSFAAGQQFPATLPPGTIYGRMPPGTGPGQAIPFATLSAQLSLFAGTVTGPASATDSVIPLFSGTTGKLLKESFLTAPGNVGLRGTVPQNQDISVVWQQSGTRSGGSQPVLQQTYWQALDSAGANQNYGQQIFQITDYTAGSLDACFYWYTQAKGATAGDYANRMQLCDGLNVNGPITSSGVALRIPFGLNTIYIAQSNGVDTPTCVSAAAIGNPCRTLQYAWDQLLAKYSGTGQNVTLRIKDGETLTKGIQVTATIPGIKLIKIVGNIHDATSSTIDIGSSTAGYCASAQFAAIQVFSLTCNGGEGALGFFDKFSIGQGGSMGIGDVIMRGSFTTLTTNSVNDISLQNGGTMTILADLYITNGHRQVSLYGGALSSVYSNNNNIRSYTTVAATTHLTVGSSIITFDNQIQATGSPAGCSITTGCALVGDQIRDNQGRIPRNAYISCIVTTGGNAYKKVRIRDQDQTAFTGNCDTDPDTGGYNVTTCGGPGTCTTTATLGGMYLHFYDDGLGGSHSAPSFDVSMFFQTEISGFNVQGIQFSGRFTTDAASFSFGSTHTSANVPFTVKGGSQLDFGSTTIASVNALPTMLPGVADGTTYAAAFDDATARNIELTQIAQALQFGVASNGGINCTAWGGTNVTPVFQANASCNYYARGTGGHLFHNGSPATLVASSGTIGGSDYVGISTNTLAFGAAFATYPHILIGAGTGTPVDSSIIYGAPTSWFHTFEVNSAPLVVIRAANTELLNPLRYGGVTLSNAVTGTGNMVLSASPTMTGTAVHAAASFSGTITTSTGSITADNGAGNTDLTVTTRAAGSLTLNSSGGGTYFQISPAASAAAYNYLQIVANTTGNGPNATVQGTDTNAGFNFRTKGTGAVGFYSQQGATTLGTFDETSFHVLRNTAATSVTTGSLINDGGFSTRGRVFMDGLTTATGAQTSYICRTANELISVAVANTCATSALRFKFDIAAMQDGALAEVMAMQPKTFRYKERPDTLLTGFIAEDVAQVDERLVTYGPEGLQGVRYDFYTAILTKAMQELKHDNDNLRIEIEEIKRRIAR